MTDHRRGLLLGVTAYVLWGGFPLYWPHLEPAGALEILAHRVLWSLLTMGLLVLLLRRRAQFRALFSHRRTFLLLAAAAFTITFNWATYIWGVNNGKVVETMVSLGLLQYLAPIIQFALGVLYFHEAMPAGRWVGFVMVWVALVMFTFGANAHRRRQLRLTAIASAA